MRLLSISTLILAILLQHGLASSQDLQAGEKLFNSNCKACHSIGKGKLVGPDLQNVSERRSKEWLHEFIPEPMKMIKAGDPVASQLFEEHNKIPMPDQTYLKETDIDNILSFITEQSTAVVEAPKEEVKKAALAKTDEVVETQKAMILSPTDYFVYAMLGVCFLLVTLVLILMFQIFNSIKTFEKKSAE